MNGKEIVQWKEFEQPTQFENDAAIPSDRAETNLEKLSKPELISLVVRLQDQVKDFAAPAALFTFILTIAFSPWRLRLTLLERLTPPIYGDYTNYLLFSSDILLILTLSLWVISLILRPRKIGTGPVFLCLPLVGLTLMGLLSVSQSVDSSLSIYHAIRLLLLLAFYFYIVNEVHSLNVLVIAAGLLIITQAMIAIPQMLKQHSINLQNLGEYLLDPSWNGVSVVSAEGIRFLRAYGLTDHPNILGGCLTFALLILGVRYVATTTGEWRPILTALLGLGSLALLSTFSRSAWLAFIASWLLIMVFSIKTQRYQMNRKWIHLSISLVLVLSPFLIYLAPFLGIRLGIATSLMNSPGEEQSIGERQLLNHTANLLFADQPLTGVGLGAFPTAMQIKFPDYPLNYQPAHFVLLDVATETGIFGALFYLLLLVGPWVALFFWRKRLHFTPSLIAATALLLAVSLVGLFDYYPWLLVPGRIWNWLAWGFWSSRFEYALKTTGEYV